MFFTPVGLEDGAGLGLASPGVPSSFAGWPYPLYAGCNTFPWPPQGPMKYPLPGWPAGASSAPPHW